ncbi:MAG: phosphatase PAP2 family protein [Flavobacteriales bacterium]|nr:phosphatase PAP2 family protein [Flavobacteriales bacterium]MCB9190322.1 phosphatase PAP2 family protein [Flavobacteriales bacterium]
MREFEKNFAMALSIIFQPIFVPLYSLILIFNANTYITYAVHDQVKLFIYGITVMNTIILPMGVFYYFYRAKLIDSLHMHTARERSLPFLTIVVFQMSTFYVFRQAPMPSLFANLVLGAAVSVAMAFIINLKWKVSIHMLGMGGIVGIIIGIILKYQVDAVPLVMALTVLSGLVGYSRLQLDAHTPLQVYAGFVLGTLILTGSVVIP